MTDLHPSPINSKVPDEALALEYLGYSIRLHPTPVEWIAVITRSNQRLGIVLAADRESALIKAWDWIASHTGSQA
jgi:hypothetical protein